MSGTYGKTSAAATKRRTNRQKVEWVPVTQLHYGKAICAAELAGVDMAIWVGDAIAAHLDRTERELHRAALHQARQEAADKLQPQVYRHEFHPEPQMPFVRRPAGVANGLAGRPSSRHHPEGRGAQGGSTARSGSGAAGAQRRGEHPPVDAPEHTGTTSRPQQPVR